DGHHGLERRGCVFSDERSHPFSDVGDGDARREQEHKGYASVGPSGNRSEAEDVVERAVRENRVKSCESHEPPSFGRELTLDLRYQRTVEASSEWASKSCSGRRKSYDRSYGRSGR